MLLISRSEIDDRVVDAVNSFLTSIATRYDIHSVWLFGSRARRTSYAESDVDLAIIVREMNGNAVSVASDMSDNALEVLIDTGVNINALPIALQDWRMPDAANAELIAEIKQHGRAIAHGDR